jgi:glycosyltransferase involved in cell wall biosynthesis
MSNKLNISVIIPCKDEEESLPELFNWIIRVMAEAGYTYEVITIDDGSSDRSWQVVEEFNKKNSSFKGIKFNRNYGKSAALNEGFKLASGEVVITMDADMQDSPDEIPELYRMVQKDGYDIVSGWKKVRHDPLSKTIPTKLYNYVTSKMSGIKLHDFNCGLKAYKIGVVKSVEVYGEMHRYIPFMAKWKGFSRIGEKVVQHRPRKYGVTKFGGLERFIRGPLDLLSISFVSKFGKRPMHFFGLFGSLSFLLGFVITFSLIAQKLYINFFQGRKAPLVTDQWIFFVALIAMVMGVQLFTAGFLGELITINSTKKNDYLVSDKLGL